MFYGDMREIIKLVFSYCFISCCSEYEQQKNIIAYCPPKMINQISKEKNVISENSLTKDSLFRNHAWFKKKRMKKLAIK